MTEEPVKQKEGNQKETTGNPSRPPEAEFFDPLDQEGGRQLRFQDFFNITWVRWIAFMLVPLLLIGFFIFQSTRRIKPSHVRVPMEAKREVVTQRSLDRAIDVSKKDENQSIPQNRAEPVKSPKRNYGTPIEVFVFKKETNERNRLTERIARQKDNRLGLPSGTKVSANLSNRIFSFNVAAPVLAFVARDVTWQGKVVIPKDSKFLGEASILKSLDRINVTFELLIFPDGHERRVRAMALSEDGSSGIKGKVQKHRDVKALKAVGETLLGGVSLFARTSSSGNSPYSLEDQLRLNLAQNLTNQAAQDLQSVKTDQSITVEAYTPIEVILLEAI